MPNPISLFVTDFLGNITGKALFDAFAPEIVIQESSGSYIVNGQIVSSGGSKPVQIKRNSRAEIIRTLTSYKKVIKALTGVAVGLVAGAAVVGGAILAFKAVAAVVGITTASVMLATVLTGLITLLWGTIVNTVNFVINFNLNISDEELDKQLVARLNAFYGLLGGVVGSATGYLVCGAIPGSVAFAFNPGVAAAAMKELDEEAREEVLQQVNVIARTAFQTLINAELSNKFKSVRRFLRLNPSNPFAKAMRKILGDENFKKWGESNRPAFTISQDIIQKRIDSIKDQRLKDFLENALENFSDSCIESGFILANNFDSQLAAYSLMNRAVLGQSTDVIITFDD